MPQAHIQLLAKNFSLLPRIEIETAIVPRVGELIDARTYLKIPEGEVADFIVESVIYKLSSDGFIPYITARQWHKGYRDELLKQRGWLSPESNDHRTYDEDDAARFEDKP